MLKIKKPWFASVSIASVLVFIAVAGPSTSCASGKGGIEGDKISAVLEKFEQN